MTTRADWEAKVAQELAGKSSAALETILPEGFAVPALADTAQLAAPFRGRFGAVKNMTRTAARDAAQLRRDVEEDVQGGADALWIAATASVRPDDVVAALGHAPSEILIAIDAGEDVSLAHAITSAVRTARPDADVRAFASPFSKGGVPADVPFAIATHAWHAAGAHDVLELAYAAATGVHSLRRLADAGVDVATAAGRIGFSVSVGRDVIVEIAKLRALRSVWAKVLAAAGVAAGPAWIHAVSSEREMARRGASNNLLRGTTSAFVALCGGADAITVLPFDAPRGAPSREARRAARNTVLILRDECAVGAVADPGGGAPAVEVVTDRLARAAWERFRAIEAKGGMAACLLSGEIRREIEQSATARGAPALIGETEFPDPEDEAERTEAGARR